MENTPVVNLLWPNYMGGGGGARGGGGGGGFICENTVNVQRADICWDIYVAISGHRCGFFVQQFDC